jgi:hypothetical protein
MQGNVSPKEVLKRCFGKLHTEYRAQIVADGAVRNKKLFTGRVNVSRSWLNQLSCAGAHSGGNLRVRAFFILSFLSQEWLI